MVQGPYSLLLTVAQVGALASPAQGAHTSWPTHGGTAFVASRGIF
jgi:hypothetical protein